MKECNKNLLLRKTGLHHTLSAIFSQIAQEMPTKSPHHKCGLYRFTLSIIHLRNGIVTIAVRLV